MAGISVARTYIQVTASDSENVCGRRVVSVYKYNRCLEGVNNTPGDAGDFCRSYRVRIHAFELRVHAPLDVRTCLTRVNQVTKPQFR